MPAALDVAFDALAPPGREWSCLAYWIGPCDVEALHGGDAIGIAQAMSYQYDVEEQADRTGTVLAFADRRKDFTPVAPVQLTQRWSPLPYAIDVLGPPDWASVEPDGTGTRAAACAWTGARTLRTPALRVPDHERFRRLLIVALMRARDLGKGVLIAAKPGWSYDHAHRPSDATRLLMERAGFVVQDRHP